MRYAILIFWVALFACKPTEKPAPPAPQKVEPVAPGPPSAAAVAEAQKIFAERCTPCHGVLGKGDGPAASALTPKPQNLGDPAWQAKVNDKHLETIIQYGGAAVGKSPAMPANPDLGHKPEVVRALTQHLRSLSAK